MNDKFKASLTESAREMAEHGIHGPYIAICNPELLDAGEFPLTVPAGVIHFVINQQMAPMTYNMVTETAFLDQNPNYRMFIHTDDWSDGCTFDFRVAIVADGWAILGVGVGNERGTEDLPITLIAINTHGGFKVYWGTNVDSNEQVLARGIRIRSEAIARRYFPMLKGVPFYKD